MTRYESNATVKSGYYFNPIDHEHRPGLSVTASGSRTRRAPGSPSRWVAALALTPLLGASSSCSSR